MESQNMSLAWLRGSQVGVSPGALQIIIHTRRGLSPARECDVLGVQ